MLLPRLRETTPALQVRSISPLGGLTLERPLSTSLGVTDTLFSSRGNIIKNEKVNSFLTLSVSTSNGIDRIHQFW